MRRCAFCGGRLGLISQRKGMLRFCKLAHKSAYIERERTQQEAETAENRGSISLVAAPLRGRGFGALISALS